MEYWVKISSSYQEGKYHYYNSVGAIVQRLKDCGCYGQNLKQKVLQNILFSQCFIINGFVIEVKQYIYEN